MLNPTFHKNENRDRKLMALIILTAGSEGEDDGRQLLHQ